MDSRRGITPGRWSTILAPTACSLLNDVLGPEMRGPSSSHAAAPYAIARTCRELSLAGNGRLRDVQVRFDPDGSFAQVHAAQGSDEGFAAGLLGVPIESPRYREALDTVRSDDTPFTFDVELAPLAEADHPNLVELVVTCEDESGNTSCDRYRAVSTGGGRFTVAHLNGVPIDLDGSTGVLLLESAEQVDGALIKSCFDDPDPVMDTTTCASSGPHVVRIRTRRPLAEPEHARLRALPSATRVREASARQWPLIGAGVPVSSARELLDRVGEGSIVSFALDWEGRLLALTAAETRDRFRQRLGRLLDSVDTGMTDSVPPLSLKLLQPTARAVQQSGPARDLVGARMHDAIAGALAVMELNTGRGLVCAAPTAGSAGILPGCLHAMRRAGCTESELTDALAVMALVGAIVAVRATFAAEVCGCAAETGVAAAMAAGGLAHLAGAGPPTVFDAAALCLMNTLGLVCDPVHGEVEIPCHARNIAGVGHAFVAAASAVGGFRALIPFDEVVDAMLEVGRQMSASLRCTARGGLATTPTALRLARR